MGDVLTSRDRRVLIECAKYGSEGEAIPSEYGLEITAIIDRLATKVERLTDRDAELDLQIPELLGVTGTHNVLEAVAWARKMKEVVTFLIEPTMNGYSMDKLLKDAKQCCIDNGAGLVTASELAKQCGVGYQTILAWRRRGLIAAAGRAVGVGGGKLLFDAVQVRESLQRAGRFLAQTGGDHV